MDLAGIVERLGGGREEKPGQWVVHCPAHEDGSPSLAVTVGGKGSVVLACRAGCSNESIIAAAGMKWGDLFMDEPKATKRIVETYSYTDEQGNELYQAIRYEPKDFRQRKSNGAGGWDWKLEGVRRVLYHLPQLLTANKSRRVFVVEGEKDVHSLESIGCVATTNAAGAGKWRPEYSQFLKGRAVTILPDNDEPGRKHAAQIKAALEKVAKSVQILELPGLPEKGDVSDWISAGGTAEQLKALVKACNSPSTTPKESPNSSGTECTASSTPEPPLPMPLPEPSVMSAKPEELGLLTLLKMANGKYAKTAAELLEKEIRG